MKKAIFTLSILLLAFCQIVISQEMDCYQSTKYYLGKDNMSFFKEAELVVEGRFLKPQHAYAVKDADGKEHYYGICPVIAYRVFKGDAKAGDTIYVIRESTSIGKALFFPFDHYPYKKDKYYDERTGDSLVLELHVQYDLPEIVFSKDVDVFDHFQNDCVMFFKTSTYPLTQDSTYFSTKQYQYLYPCIFYDEGTKLYVSEGKFAGLNDTLFNSRQDLYAFMRKAGGYDLSVIGADTINKSKGN